MTLDEAIEHCEDCISREAALNELNEAYDLIDAEHRIKELKPVTSKPKIGKWIKYGAPRCGEQHYICTSCGYYINFGQWGKFYTKEFKYCPNCRAKMEVKE